MGFFDSLRRTLTGNDADPAPLNSRMSDAWDRYESVSAEAPEDAVAYDRSQWHKKLKRIIDETPAEGEWPDLRADGLAVGIDLTWIEQALRDEFAMVVRRAVSDRVFTEAEHRRIDLIRDRLGLTETEAETILAAVVAEAEDFFGGAVQDT